METLEGLMGGGKQNTKFPTRVDNRELFVIPQLKINALFSLCSTSDSKRYEVFYLLKLWTLGDDFAFRCSF